MLIFKINAGLGNQMFQYAAGRALSLRYGCEFRIDTSEVGLQHSGIGIKAFNITAKEASPEDVTRFTGKEIPYIIRKIS